MKHLRIRIDCVHAALDSGQQEQKKDSDSVMLDVV
jgi:hypothetical protein